MASASGLTERSDLGWRSLAISGRKNTISGEANQLAFVTEFKLH